MKAKGWTEAEERRHRAVGHRAGGHQAVGHGAVGHQAVEYGAVGHQAVGHRAVGHGAVSWPVPYCPFGLFAAFQHLSHFPHLLICK